MLFVNKKRFAMKFLDKDIFCSQNKSSDLLSDRPLISSITEAIFDAYKNTSFHNYWQDNPLIIKIYGSNIYLEEKGKLYADDIDIEVFFYNEIPCKDNNIVPDSVKNDPVIHYSKKYAESYFIKDFANKLNNNLILKDSAIGKVSFGFNEFYKQVNINDKGVPVSITLKNESEIDDFDPMALYVSNEQGVSKLHQEFNNNFSQEEILMMLVKKCEDLYQEASQFYSTGRDFDKIVKRLLELSWMVKDNKTYNFLLKLFSDIKSSAGEFDSSRIKEALLLVKNNIVDNYSETQLKNKFKTRLLKLNIFSKIIY